MSYYTGVKWGDAARGTSGGVVTWSFAKFGGRLLDFGATIDVPTFQAEIRSAFAIWEAVADIDFREVADS